MAFNDTLFQLGMDLTRSSPAHEEDFARVVRAAHEDRNAGSGEAGAEQTARDLHLDLIAAGKAATQKSIERAMVGAVSFVRGRVLSSTLQRDTVTGAIAGSVATSIGDISLEAWPSTGYVALTLTGSGLRPEMAMTAFGGAFGARETIVKKARLAGDGARWKKVSVASAVAEAPRRVAPRRPAMRTQKARAA